MIYYYRMIHFMNKKGNIGLIVLIFLVLVVVFISIISNKLHDEVTQLNESKKTPPEAAPETVTPPAAAAPSSASKSTSTKLLRKTIVVRGNDFLEHWFYRGEEVVAKQQVNNDGVLNTEGIIPEGRIDFVDTYKNTTGEEHYRKGVRDGNSTTYYTDGKLKETAKYDSGKLIAKTEYYTDGRKRFEVDYTDSRNLGGDVETGIGKLYYPNEKLKFEWHLTRRDPVGFKKSYNQDGTLRHAAYFDEDNNLIETQEPQKEAAAAAAEQESLMQPSVQP